MTSEWRRRAEKYLRDNPKIAASVTTRLLDDFSFRSSIMSLAEFNKLLNNEGGSTAFWEYGAFRNNVSSKDAWVYISMDYGHAEGLLHLEGISIDNAGARFVEILNSADYLDDIENGHIEDDYLPEEIRLKTKSASSKRKTAAKKAPTTRKTAQTGTSKARKTTGARR